MSPDQISMLTSLVSLVKMFSSWPVVGLLFVVIVGPWMVSLMLAERYRRRFEAVVRMYESNVMLVKNYEMISRDMKDIVIMNTTAVTSLTEVIRQTNR